MSARDLVIKVDDVRKRYRLGVLGSDLLAEEAMAVLGRIRGRARSSARDQVPAEGQHAGDYFWSLRGVSFDVARGEVLGIIGRNGAGKSTLLKLLSRITLPTAGTIRMRGKVSSLLEVGTGFHPELTGRENIYLNGAILGMRKAEIDRKLDEIIAFSGIEHHIDTPIKRYSSGMKVRLGFSVAAHLDPEILIVDEVLAVGDAEFQRKCLGSMREVAAGGRTILFVSHSMAAVQSLCSRGLWIDKGSVRADGEVTTVVRDYLSETKHSDSEQEWAKGEGPGTDQVRLLRVRAFNPEGEAFTTDSPVHIEVELDNLNGSAADLDVRVHLRTETDAVAFLSDMSNSIPDLLWSPGPNKVTCVIPPNLLNAIGYRLWIVLFQRGTMLARVEDVLSFEVHEGAREGASFRKVGGAVRPLLQWVR